MCGIAAIFSTGPTAPPVDGDELGRINDAMIRRGPDGSGLWLSEDRRIGLAHRRLAILDLSDAGSQPMFSADGRVAIVFNGEIYNFRALRRQLEQQGFAFRSQCDTEVLLALYRRDGLAMVDHLRGMFAFALWDGEKRRLVLGRDPFGIKPLYIATANGTIRVASQVKALLAGGGLASAPSAAGHAGFLLWGHVPEPFTLFQAVEAVPPGKVLSFGADGRREERRFFDLRAELAAPASDPGMTLEQALADSVEHHLVSDVPVGLFLSSGIDSAALAGLAARAPLGVEAVTLGFAEYEGTASDEVPLASLIASLYGLKHAVRRVTAADFRQARPRLLDDMDQPSVDGVNSWMVARAAHEVGLKVALSGLGGDELFAGYPSFRQIPQLAGWLAPFRHVPALGRGFRHVAAPLLRRRSPKWAGLLELGTRDSDVYLLRRGLFMPWELPDLIDPDMARDGWRELDCRARLADGVSGIVSPRLRVTALETAWYMRNQLLRDSDWAGMSHSLEIRLPLVDIGLFRALLPLIKGPRPPGKEDVAACPSPPLPPPVKYRPKTGFSIPVAEWLGTGIGVRERGLRGWALTVLAAFSGHGG
jgi:asparagine synthase (glutamine-hydrolysing)